MKKIKVKGDIYSLSGPQKRAKDATVRISNWLKYEMEPQETASVIAAVGFDPTTYGFETGVPYSNARGKSILQAYAPV